MSYYTVIEQDGKEYEFVTEQPTGEELHWLKVVDGQMVVDEAKKAVVLKERAAKTWLEGRQKEYPRTDELVVALWERLVEGRPEASEALQAKREAIKQKYPKPESK